MWGKHHNDFRLIVGLLFLREEVSQYGNVLQPRPPVKRCRFGVGNDSTQNIGFTLNQPDFMLNLTVRKYRLGDASHVLRACQSPDLNHDGYRDLMVEEDARRYIQVYANVDKLEVDNWSPGGSYKRRLKTSGRNWKLLTDADRGQFPVCRTDTGVLEQPCIRTSCKELSCRRRNSHGELGRCRR